MAEYKEEIKFLKEKFLELSIHGNQTGFYNIAIKDAIGKQIEILEEA